MFLFARSGERPARERYDFRPYDYGPMSSQIYSDLDTLVSKGLLAAEEVSGKHWSRYVATPRGRSAAAAKLRRLTSERDKRSARQLYEIKQSIANVSFNELLDRVYEEHPDMAVNSVFRPVSS
jgi:DNA-binding PadR family transcriptional regulator